MDLALAIQQVIKEMVLRLARTAREITGCRNLVMAGGVALNCLANGKLLRSGIFEELTGCGLVVNTSFNVRGEPIVCTPEDAYACFMRTEMDYLVVGNTLFCKAEQPKWQEGGNWRDRYELD